MSKRCSKPRPRALASLASAEPSGSTMTDRIPMSASPIVSRPSPKVAARIGGWRAAILSLAVALLAGTTGYCWFLGYFGGPVYTLVPPRSSPAPISGRGTVAVYFSGDLGFNTGMGPRIARGLANRGIPVLGVNSLTLFARERSRAEAAAIVGNALERALAIPGARRLVLIGQSFGANIMIEGARALSPAQRAHVALLAALTPSNTTLLQASPGGIVDLGPEWPTLPAARELNWAPVVCIRGQSEERSLCPQWLQPNIRSITLPGGHFLNDDAALVARTVMRAILTTANRRPRTETGSLPNVEAP